MNSRRLKLLVLFCTGVVVSSGMLLWLHFSKSYYGVCTVTYNKNNYPLIAAEFQGQNCMLATRVGSRFPLFLSKEILDKIDKQPQGAAQWHSLDGQKHEGPAYLIPKITVGTLTLTNVIAYQSQKKDQGVLGKFLGEEFNLLLDFPHSRIIACDSFSKLQAKKLVGADWVHVPFEMQRVGIVFDVNTKLGTKKLAINTTCALTHLRTSLLPFDQSPISSFLSLGGQNFGQIEFQPIDLPDGLNEIDGFIGMDFLKNHSIYLDYSNKTAYIEPPPIYFEHFPIAFGDGRQPVINVSIEGKTYPLELDLGNSTSLTLNQEILQNIHKDTYGTTQWSDFKGNRYQSPSYTIPQVLLGNLSLFDVLAHEDREDFHINVSSEPRASLPIGAIGRPILEKYNLFLDFPHSAVYASNSYLPLQQAGLLSKNLLAIPFTLHPDGILLSVETDTGVQRLILDTGATHTVIRAPYATSTAQFRLAGHDFGARSLIPIDLCSPLDYEGFLGLDFLCEYSLFIDYPNKRIFLDLQQEH